MKTLKKPESLVLYTATAALLLGASTLTAENVFVTGYKGTAGSTDVMPEPPCAFTGVSLFGASSGSASTASPTPIVPASSRRVVYGNATNASWKITPTDVVVTPASGAPNYAFKALQPNNVYKIYVTDGESGNASPDLLVSLTATGGRLADTNGVASTNLTLDCFRNTSPDDTWIHIGYLTNDVASPTLTFSYLSGTIASTGGRWYMDAVWFENIKDVCAGVASEVQVTGPLSAGQSYVNVTGVSEGATQVIVMADGTAIGMTNYASGFAAGTVAVPTQPLAKGQIINAIQSKPNSTGTVCSSDPGSSGVVGGGNNARLTAYLGCFKNSTNAGPIGVDSAAPSTGFPYFLKSTGVIANFGSAPAGGAELVPSDCWQTVTFMHGVDSATDQNDNSQVNNTDPFCSLESLIFSIVDTDSGPYDIYIDSIVNGETVVENFESYGVGTTNTFNTPNTAVFPAALSTYLSAPHGAVISDRYAFDGSKSLRVTWQWLNNSNIRWARTPANAPSGKRYPQLDTRLPIVIRYLVVPVANSTAHKFNGTVSQIISSGAPYAGTTNTLSVQVTGGPFTYEWFWEDASLALTTPSIKLGENGGLNSGANGKYKVVISDGVCRETRTFALTVLDPIPIFTLQPSSEILQAGSTGIALRTFVEVPSELGHPVSFMWLHNGTTVVPDQSSTNLSFPAGAQLSDVGAYELVAINNYGVVTSKVATISVVPSGIAKGTGTGLSATYYTLHTNNAPFTGAPAISRIDPQVDFSWAAASPDAAVSSNYFTARWFGEVQALGTDTYTFETVRDDGVRLWVNGQLLIDGWDPSAPITNSATIALTGTQKYPVLLEYFEQTGNALARLWWSTAGGSVPQTAIPMSQLYPVTFDAPVITLTSPANPSSVILPASVNLAATLTANDGLIESVQFLTNGTLLAQSAAAPYTYEWVNPPAGSYNVTARVIYNKSSAVDSAAAALTVSQQLGPVSGLNLAVGSGNVTVSYSGGVGSKFVLLKSVDVGAAMNTWTRVATNSTASGSFVIPVGAEARAFYRVLSE